MIHGQCKLDHLDMGKYDNQGAMIAKPMYPYYLTKDPAKLYRPTRSSPLANSRPSPQSLVLSHPQGTQLLPASGYVPPKERSPLKSSSSESSSSRKHWDSSQMNLVETLKGFPLFAGAPESFLTSIADHLRPQIHAPRDEIIAEGEVAKAMYFIIRGSVCVTSRDGESYYAELKAGAFFGEIGVLFSMPRTASVIAQTRCLVVALTADDLHSQLPNYPDMERTIREEAETRLQLQRHMQRGDVLPRVNGGSVVNVRHSIAKVPAFSTLPAYILHFLAMQVLPRYYAPFTTIIKQDDPAPEREIFFIVAGTVEVLDETGSRDGRPSRVKARLGPTQYFGEFAFFDPMARRTASVRSITYTTCLALKGSTLQNIIGAYPDVEQQFQKTLDDRLSLNLEFSQSKFKDAASGVDAMTGIVVNGSDPDPFSVRPEINNQEPISLPQSTPNSPTMSFASSYSHLYSPEVLPSKRVKVARSHKIQFEGLPERIVGKIFQDFTVKELMILRLVSRGWAHLLSSSNSILSVLDLSVHNKLVHDNNIHAIVAFANKRPRTLDITNCFHISDTGFRLLIDGLAINVEILRMSSVWEVSGALLREFTSSASYIKELDVSNCRKLGDSTMISILQSSISYPPLPDSFGTKSHNAKPLEVLEMSYCKHITDRTMHYIAQNLADQLQTIDMTRCTGVTDAGFRSWSYARFDHLESLCLADCTFLTDNAVISLSRAARMLRHLDLVSSSILLSTKFSIEFLLFPE